MLELREDKMDAKKIILIDEKDNVVTALVSLKKNETVEFEDAKIEVADNINFGHKLAIKKINKGDFIYKYGEKIGKAKKDINIGEHVHINNIEDIVDELRKEYKVNKREGSEM